MIAASYELRLCGGFSDAVVAARERPRGSQQPHGIKNSSETNPATKDGFAMCVMAHVNKDSNTKRPFRAIFIEPPAPVMMYLRESM